MFGWLRRNKANTDEASVTPTPEPDDAPISAADVDRVQASFALVAPIADQAAALFYDRLFVIAPEVRPLFKGDLSEQGAKLMGMLTVVVNGLKNLEAVVPPAEELARRHVKYGVEAAHYDKVGEALIWTLEQGLGDGFTADVREAWVTTYGVLSGVMIKAAYPVKAA